MFSITCGHCVISLEQYMHSTWVHSWCWTVITPTRPRPGLTTNGMNRMSFKCPLGAVFLPQLPHPFLCPTDQSLSAQLHRPEPISTPTLLGCSPPGNQIAPMYPLSRTPYVLHEKVQARTLYFQLTECCFTLLWLWSQGQRVVVHSEGGAYSISSGFLFGFFKAKKQFFNA